MGRESSSSTSSASSGGVGGGGGGGRDMVMKPAWLDGLMAETFFDPCGLHDNRRKNEKNIFCLDCCQSFCTHCLPSHRSHPLLQVRRYVYNDVIRLEDLEKLIDCSFIQPYTINSAKVIFLHKRAQSRSCKGSSATNNCCCYCDRILQDSFHFCSLSCKVDHMVYCGEELTSILYRFEESDFSFSQFEGLRMDGSDVADEDGQITPNSFLEEQLQYKGMSCSGSEMGNSGISHDPDRKMKKKKKGTGFLPGIVLSLSNRRKGAPQRSPLS